jgi:phage terminase Nu1 subunit (DNA packaging protein)
MPLANQSAFAALHAVSRKTVTKWKERGWLVFQGDQVDVDASNALLEKYRAGGIGKSVTHDVAGNKQGNKSKAVTLIVAEPDESIERAAERIMVATGAGMTIDEAKRVKENYLALLNQLEYDRESGLVVMAADVAKAVGEEYAKVRTRLLAIPAEQAPRIHRLKSVTEVQDALQELITEALEELIKDGAS